MYVPYYTASATSTLVWATLPLSDDQLIDASRRSFSLRYSYDLIFRYIARISIVLFDVGVTGTHLSRDGSVSCAWQHDTQRHSRFTVESLLSS